MQVFNLILCGKNNLSIVTLWKFIATETMDCQVCGLNCSSKWSLKRHLARTHGQQDGGGMGGVDHDESDSCNEDSEGDKVSVSDMTDVSEPGSDDDSDDSDYDDSIWQEMISKAIKNTDLPNDIADIFHEPYLSEFLQTLQDKVMDKIWRMKLLCNSEIYKAIVETRDDTLDKENTLTKDEAMEVAWEKRKFLLKKLMKSNMKLFEEAFNEESDDDNDDENDGNENNDDENYDVGIYGNGNVY